MEWKALIARVGSVAAIADIVGKPYTTVHSRVYRGQDLPAEWAKALHESKQIPLSELRPDLWPADSAA